MDVYKDRVEVLRRRLQDMESAVVAFSGGVDSSVLVVLAHDVLRGQMIAATAISPGLPRNDVELIVKFCAERKIPHRFVRTNEFEDQAFISNPEDRCYHCKRHLYDSLVSLCDEHGLRYVIEGTNASDLEGHRPGYLASSENPRVITPLVDAGLTKDDVRRLASELALPTANKPAAACLSSRVPAGTELEPGLLRRIDAAEDALRGVGVGQARLRHHGELARIEVDERDMGICLEHRLELIRRIRGLGWRFVTLDLAGYRTGGMNK